MSAGSLQVRVGLVLSAGGLRGAAHLGVMRALLRHKIPIHVLIGVSAGAVIAAYYAAVGVPVEELIQEARRFRGRHVIFHGLNLRAPRYLKPLLGRLSGVIPERLRQLEDASFDRLHYGVEALGIVCHDLVTNRPLYFATGRNQNAALSEVVKASASIPGLIPSRPMIRKGRLFHLVDGGLSDSLPIDFARSSGLEATHLIASDCRTITAAELLGDNMVYLRPDLRKAGILRSPRATLLEVVHQGEAAVTEEAAHKIQRWLDPNG